MKKTFSLVLLFLLVIVWCSSAFAVNDAVFFSDGEAVFFTNDDVTETQFYPRRDKTDSSYDTKVIYEDSICTVTLENASVDEENGWGITVRCVNNSKPAAVLTEEAPAVDAADGEFSYPVALGASALQSSVAQTASEEAVQEGAEESAEENNTDLVFSWQNSAVMGENSEVVWEDTLTVKQGKMRALSSYASDEEEAEYYTFRLTVKNDDTEQEVPPVKIRRAYGRTYIFENDYSPVMVDFDGLTKRNGDVCAWLYSPDTVISYPVVQTGDNSYYLHLDIDKNYSSYGTLFIETLDEPGINSDNTIIYGHHMNDGSMFASIVNYAKQNYYEKHPVLYLNTPEINYRVDVFAALLTDMYSDVYTTDFMTDADQEAWLAAVKDASAIETDVEVHPGDRMLTLSTCTYEYDTARYAVIGKLVPIE